jgi:CBS domain-containing protein
MLSVSSILNSKTTPFHTIPPDALVLDAIQKLSQINLSYLVVMDQDKYLGIFSERDYTRNVLLKGKSSSTATVQEVMSKNLPTVDITDTVDHCLKLMTNHGTRYLIVFEKDEFLGVITIHDVLRFIISNHHLNIDRNLANHLLNEDEGGKIY